MVNRRQFLVLFSAGLASSPFRRNFANPPAGSPLVLGVFPRRNIQSTYQLFTPLALYLEKRLQRPVHLETSRTFNEFWKAVQARRYDLVHYNQYHYIVSRLKYGYEVIAKNQEMGKSTIAGALIVRKDSGIEKVSDLKGKTILFGGGKSAMQSYISATWLLRQGSLRDGDYLEKFAINPPNAIISTYFRRADASGSGDVVMRLDNVTRRIDISQLKFLARTQPMAHLPWAVKAGLADELKNDITLSLLNLPDTLEGQGVLQSARLDALVSASDAEYDPHRKIIIDVYGKDYGIARLNEHTSN